MPHRDLEWDRSDLSALGGKRPYILDMDGNILASSEHLRHWIRRIAWSLDKTGAVTDVGIDKLHVWKLSTEAVV